MFIITYLLKINIVFLQLTYNYFRVDFIMSTRARDLYSHNRIINYNNCR